jgi:hypothetical protein
MPASREAVKAAGGRVARGTTGASSSEPLRFLPGDGPDALLVAAAFLHGSPRAQLAAIDAARAAAAARGGGGEKRGGFGGAAPLFPYAAEAHQAAWLLQRCWKKRQLRRGAAQTLILRAFHGWQIRRHVAAAAAFPAALVLGRALARHVRRRRRRAAQQLAAARRVALAVVRLQALVRGRLAQRQRGDRAAARIARAALVICLRIKARLALRRKRRRRDAYHLSVLVRLQVSIHT